MKLPLVVTLVLAAATALAADASLPSQVAAWQRLPVEKTAVGERRAILEGATLDLARFIVHASTVGPGQSPHAPHRHDLEEMLIVKEGRVRVTVEGKSQDLGPGSVALFSPGEEHGLTNIGDGPTTYYVIRYETKAGRQPATAGAPVTSFNVDWDAVPFQPFATGGRRQIFDRPTAMFANFETHVTTLNAGLQNHATHTHRVEELVVLLKGEVEMQIGDAWQRASAGDVVFLASQIPHALRNVGDGPTEYFAIQWRVAAE